MVAGSLLFLSAVGSGFLFRPVDRVLPKGVTRPVEILELVGVLDVPGVTDDAVRATDADVTYCAQWASAYGAFQARDWARAVAAFSSLGGRHARDRLATLYAERSAAYAEEPPPPDWDGAAVFKTK